VTIDGAAWVPLRPFVEFMRKIKSWQLVCPSDNNMCRPNDGAIISVPGHGQLIITHVQRRWVADHEVEFVQLRDLCNKLGTPSWHLTWGKYTRQVHITQWNKACKKEDYPQE
jgi:hypothetical protein